MQALYVSDGRGKPLASIWISLAANAALTAVCALFALIHINEDAADFELSRGQRACVGEAMRELLLVVRRDAVALVDAFEFPDNVLNSALGRHDGRVYEALYAGALANMGQHVIIGGTTSADHHWVYRNGVPKDYVDRTIDAARAIGMRFHPSRGCMTLGEKAGGNMPEILAACWRLGTSNR